MPHMHWVVRQNKLELPNDEEEVNTRDIHKCDGQAHDPDTMAAPLTPQADTKSRSPRQGAADHCLNSRRRRCAEGSGEATVMLCERHI